MSFHLIFVQHVIPRQQQEYTLYHGRYIDPTFLCTPCKTRLSLPPDIIEGKAPTRWRGELPVRVRFPGNRAVELANIFILYCCVCRDVNVH